MPKKIIRHLPPERKTFAHSPAGTPKIKQGKPKKFR